MRWRNSTEGYGAVPQMLHWITVAMVVVAWLLGQFDDVFPRARRARRACSYTSAPALP
jgi:cytochrome b561